MALAGLKVIEFAGLAPGPFAGLVLADNGADVIRVDKLVASSNDILCRGKRSIAIDAKTSSGRHVLKKLIATADILIDPFRPGVLEKLGLGPDVFLGSEGANERLIYASIYGFPKTGPHKDMAGHDINYIALSGVLSMLPGSPEKPAFPLNLLADFAGGGLMCALGILLALITRFKTGRGQVVDVDMVSGTRYLSSFPLLHILLSNSPFSKPRGENLLDGGAPFYNVYVCKNDSLMTVGCLEPQFFETFLKCFIPALPGDFALQDGWRPTIRSQTDRGEWPRLKEFLTKGFQTNTREYWTAVFHNTDACVVPVLSLKEASEYAAFKSSYPRISAGTVTEGLKLQPGSHTEDILRELGLTNDEVRILRKDGAFGSILGRPKSRL